MKSDAIAFGIAGVVFGLIAGWIIGTQQAGARDAGSGRGRSAAPPSAGAGGQTTRAAVLDEAR